MKTPTSNFTHLWNDMPQEERERLMPYMIESQILHIWQTRQAAIRAHQKHMKELDAWVNNLTSSLNKIKAENICDKDNV